MHKNQKSTNYDEAQSNVILNKLTRRFQFDLWFGEKKKESIKEAQFKKKRRENLIILFSRVFARNFWELFSFRSLEKKVSRSETLEEETSKISELSQVLENQVKIFDEKKWKFEVGFSGVREPILKALPNFF